MRHPTVAALLLTLGACSSPTRLTVLADPAALATANAFVELLPGGLVTVSASADPTADLARASGPRAALLADLSCGDCFQIEPRGGDRFVIHGGSLLGVQYGLAQLLEEAGFRFFHPRHTLTPSTIALPAASRNFGRLVTPAKRLRGLHVHTLHPIEAHFDLLEPSPEHLDGAKRLVDWLIKNRGNYLQWAALNDIARDPAARAAWQPHARAIVDYAHARGVTVGVDIELFHGGNLQQAYDLLDTPDLANGADTHALLQQRLTPLVGEVPFDRLGLTFGEFFGANPDTLIQQINNTFDALQAIRPGMEMTSRIHVGNAPNQHVMYQGKDYLYYFLAQFANDKIIPWIHSVMYYNLFEDAGGAYLHDDFGLHRQFLLDRLATHRRVAYLPEGAYWVTFDNSVPAYLPVYLYSRWLDIDQIDRQSKAGGGDPLTEHALFSTGWEWGYWQNDYVTLRMSFETPDHWSAPIEEMLAPYGAKGGSLAAQVSRLALLQHDALIIHRLAPYIAGVDFLLEAGWASGVVSQPPRPSFAEVAGRPADARAAFVTAVLTPLEQLAADTDDVGRAVDAIGLDGGDPWVSEIRDGIAVDAARARFVAALYRAALAHAGGTSPDAALALADRALADGRAAVTHRHAHLHDPDPRRILGEGPNRTIYHYGYLNLADTLCYWERDRAQARRLTLGTGDDVPGCALGY